MVSPAVRFPMDTSAATDVVVSSSCAKNSFSAQALIALGTALVAVPFFTLLALLDGLLLLMRKNLQCRHRIDSLSPIFLSF